MTTDLTRILVSGDNHCVLPAKSKPAALLFFSRVRLWAAYVPEAIAVSFGEIVQLDQRQIFGLKIECEGESCRVWVERNLRARVAHIHWTTLDSDIRDETFRELLTIG